MKREAAEQGEEEGVTCPRKRINPHILIQVFFFVVFFARQSSPRARASVYLHRSSYSFFFNFFNFL